MLCKTGVNCYYQNIKFKTTVLSHKFLTLFEDNLCICSKDSYIQLCYTIIARKPCLHVNVIFVNLYRNLFLSEIQWKMSTNI